MDGLGHFGPMEDPDRVANVVADFFAGATGG
jgi:pimeloyl-ACP methyl ester carboxylesterase